jgi:hypothetical protein
VTIGPHRSACGLLALLAGPALAQTSSLSADTIVSVAKRDIGKIDREVRTEFKQSPLSASVDTAMGRLAKGIEQAHAEAPDKWYQAAKVEDITPPGDDARKIYRVTTALGTYCARHRDKNRAGFDQGQANLGEPLLGVCPGMF